jgi:hypothetical protein
VRGRREDGGETRAPQPAAETIEIVPDPADERAAEETTAAFSLEPWPGDSGVEAASLAPLAGESFEPRPAPLHAPEHGQEHGREHGREHHERELPAAPTAEAEEGVPFIGETERVFEEAAVGPGVSEPAPPEASSAPPEPANPNGANPNGPNQNGASPNEDVLTVTEKPSNPRRGWWQRLVQP